MNLGRSHDDKGGKAAVQIQKRVHFDSRLGRPKLRPREQGQTEIDGRGIQGIGCALQIGAQRFTGVKGSCLANQDLRPNIRQYLFSLASASVLLGTE